MEQSTTEQRGAREPEQRPPCDAELHVRLCARRLSTGHLQFCWRLEHVDNIDQEGDSLDGSFGPFQLPHESANEVAAAVRHWLRRQSRKHTERGERPDDTDGGEQLTLRGFLRD